MLSELIEIAPDNAKINAYIVKTYLAYGYPEEAYSYYKDNKSRMDNRNVVRVLSTLYSDALKNGDEPRILEMLGELITYHSRDNHSPYEIVSILNYKSRLIKFYSEKKQYKKAVQLADDDLKWFERAAVEEMQSKFWSNDRIRNVEDLKCYYRDLIYQSGKLNHLQYRAVALIKLGIKKDYYEPFNEVIETIKHTKMTEKCIYRPYIPYQLFRVYNSMAMVAKEDGNTEMEKELRKTGQEHYKQYRKWLDDRRKARAEAAKKRKEAEEAAKKKKEQEEKEKEE